MVAAVGAAAAIGGSLISANATKKAAGGQEAASREANELQRYMYDRNVELAMPTINAGNMARDSLLYRLGLSRNAPGTSAPSSFTEAQLREQLTPQFTTQRQLSQQDPLYRFSSWNPQAFGDALEPSGFSMTGNAPQYASEVNTAELDAEVARRLAAQDQARKDYEAQASADPAFGDLAQKFTFDEYTPAEKYEAGKFSYTGEDLYKDPSYQFRLDQGQKALDRSGAAAGRFLSGRQLQAASDYNQGAASQEFQNAYTRALGTFGTNETGRYNAFQTNETNRKNAFDTNQQNRFNAYQANFSNSINPLLSLSGSGQVGAQYLGGAGQQTAQLMSNNLMGAANASGAAQIAGANAISSGINSAVGGYQQNQLLNQLMNRNTGVNNNPGGTNAGYWNAWATSGTGGD